MSERYGPCVRKKHYASYAQAKEVLGQMRERGSASPTLHVYRCDALGGEHFHLGNAKGEEARRLKGRESRTPWMSLISPEVPRARRLVLRFSTTPTTRTCGGSSSFRSALWRPCST